MFKISINNNVYEYEDKITLTELAKRFMPDAIIAKVDNRLREWQYEENKV